METWQHYPLVSICITSYNYGRYIADAIDSALAQTYPHIEVIVCDNCSTDETSQVLERYREDARVVIVHNPENIGMVRNHNRAVQHAKGEYIVVLSADDVLFPTHVSLLASRALDINDPVEVVYANVAMLDEQLNPVCLRSYRGALRVAYSGRDDFANAINNYYLSLPAKLIARRVYEELGYFDEMIMKAFDVDFCIRMEFAEYRIAFITDMVAGLRAHTNRSSMGDWQFSEGYMHDKIQYLEKVIKPENAWRFEGSERYLYEMLKGELEAIETTQGMPVEPQLQSRFTAVQDSLLRLQGVRHPWPSYRPRVSVIVTSDGYLPLLNITLNSLAVQQYQDFEIIVVQGGGASVSAWLQVLPFRNRIRYLDAKALRKLATARHTAIEISRGQLITVIAEGQVALPYHLDRLVFGLDSGNVEVAISARDSILDCGYQVSFDMEKREHCFEEPFLRSERLQNPDEPSLAAILHRRSIYRQYPFLEEGYLDLTEGEMVAYFLLHHSTMSVYNEDPDLPKRYVSTYTYDSSAYSAQRQALTHERNNRLADERAQLLSAAPQ